MSGRVRAVAVAGCLLLAAGCSVRVQAGAPGGAVDCAFTDRQPTPGLILTAQSVPTAQWLPCVRTLPVGWSFRELKARNGQTRIRFDVADQAGGHSLTIVLEAACDLAGTSETASDEPAMRRYDLVAAGEAGYRADRYYRFPGGCIAYHFDIRGGGRAGSGAAAAVSTGLGFVSRSDVAAAVDEHSHGRLTLDPVRP